MIGRLALLILLVSGCSGRHQQGKYAVSSTEVKRLESQPGYAVAYRGSHLDREGGPMGDQQTLLTVALLSPKVGMEQFNAEHTHGETVSVSVLRWRTIDEQFVRVEWNRSTDVLSVGNQQFDRSKGSFMLIIPSPEDGLVCLQVANEAAVGTPEEGVDKWLELGDADEIVIKRSSIE